MPDPDTVMLTDPLGAELPPGDPVTIGVSYDAASVTVADMAAEVNTIR